MTWRPAREPVQHAGQRAQHVTGQEPHRVPPGHLDRGGQPGQRGGLRRRARLQPRPGRRVLRVQGVAVDADPLGDGREHGPRWPPGAADVAAQGHGGRARGRTPGHRPGSGSGPGAAPGRRRCPGRPGRPGPAREPWPRRCPARSACTGPPRSSGTGVPGITATMSSSRAEMNARAAPGKPPSIAGLRPPRFREVAGQRRRPVPADQVRDGRAGQQGRQPVGRQRGQPAQEFLVGGDGPEQARRSAARTPARRRATSRPPPPGPGPGSPLPRTRHHDTSR